LLLRLPADWDPLAVSDMGARCGVQLERVRAS
jgi:hypothetical protein